MKRPDDTMIFQFDSDDPGGLFGNYEVPMGWENLGFADLVAEVQRRNDCDMHEAFVVAFEIAGHDGIEVTEVDADEKAGQEPSQDSAAPTWGGLNDDAGLPKSPDDTPKYATVPNDPVLIEKRRIREALAAARGGEDAPAEESWPEVEGALYYSYDLTPEAATQIYHAVKAGRTDQFKAYGPSWVARVGRVVADYSAGGVMRRTGPGIWTDRAELYVTSCADTQSAVVRYREVVGRFDCGGRVY